MCTTLRDVNEVVRTILTNPKTLIETIMMVAKEADEDTCELIARNQIRLLESSELIETLFLNKNMRSSSVDRMLDFAARNQIQLHNIDGYEEMLIDFGERPQQSEEDLKRADEIFKTTMDAIKADLETNDAESNTNTVPISARDFKTGL